MNLRSWTFCLLGGVLALTPHVPLNAAAPIVIEDDDDDPMPLNASDVDTGPETKPAPSKPVEVKPSKPNVPKAKPKRSTPTPPPKPAPEPDPAESEAKGPDAGDCPTHDCGPAPYKEPGSPVALDSAMGEIRGRAGDLLGQNGAKMSCAQRNLLEAAQRVNCRQYGYRDFSKGDCGGGVGQSIVAAGIPFEKGPRTEHGRYTGRTRFAIDYMKFGPEYHFIPLKITREEDAPDGALLVFQGPCTNVRGINNPHRSLCNPRAFHGNGERVGHVTIKGSTSMDHGAQRYYTDGRTVRPAIDRRYFVGAFLPPGSDRGPCARTESPVSPCREIQTRRRRRR